MSPAKVELEKALLEATERVQAKLAPLALQGDRGKSVGIGASGDTTIFADKAAEDELLRTLRPFGVKVLSEEAGETGDSDAKTLAVLDPLDGSSNFERGIPFYCTSAAVAEGGSLEDISFGVVRNLVNRDVYIAKRGQGATKNGRRIRTSRTSKLSEAVVGVDLSRSAPRLIEGLVPLVSAAKRQVHLGANALEICLVAEGRIDAFVDVRGKIRVTDFAAAYLIAKEAGAVITDREGAEPHVKFDLDHRFSFVASSNSALHDEILGLLGGSKAGGG